MVIDFRVRPPYKSFMDLGIVKGWQNPSKEPRKMKVTGFERRDVPSVDQASIELMIKEMQTAGIKKGVIMGRQTWNPVYGDCKNEDVQELVTKYPDLLIGFGGISPYNPEALKEIEHMVKVWGFKGISIDAGWCNPPMYAHDSALFPIMDLCQSLGVVLVLTMSMYVGPDLSYTDPTQLIPVLRQFPNLKVVLAHGAFPKIQEALGAAALCNNLYLAPDCYYYVRNMPFAHEFTKAANSYLKWRFLFASSYPIRGFEQCVENWSSMGLDPDALQNSLYNNAAELLQL